MNSQRQFAFTVLIDLAFGCGTGGPEDLGQYPVALSQGGEDQFAGVYDAEAGNLVLTTDLVNAVRDSNLVLLREDVAVEFEAQMTVGSDLTPGDSFDVVHINGAQAADLRIESHEWLDRLSEAKVVGSFPIPSFPDFKYMGVLEGWDGPHPRETEKEDQDGE